MLNSVERLALSTVARGRLNILIFHRVLAEADPLFPDEIETCEQFDAILGWIKSWFIVLPLEQAVRDLASGSLPARAACITFDDGYADNHRNALPLLRKHELSATFFIATGFLDGGRMWNDSVIEAVRRSDLDEIDAREIGLGVIPLSTLAEKRAAIGRLIPKLKHEPPAERTRLVSALADLAGAELPDDLMMTSDQVREMRAAGMGIGAHTVSHPILAACDAHVAKGEIADSRQRLEELLGESISLFAYPNGKRGDDYEDAHVQMVRELGFDAAVSTNPGLSGPADNIYELRRYTPWRRKRFPFLAQLLSNGLTGSGRP